MVTGFFQVDATANLFSFGMDSLHVINLVRAINSAVPNTDASLKRVTSKVVCANPTLGILANACEMALESRKHRLHEDEPGTETNEVEMRKLIIKYSWDLPITSHPPAPVPLSNGMYVLLTGSTGSLGLHILASLLDCPRAVHIYYLNLSIDAHKRQREWWINRGMIAEWSSQRASFFQSDWSGQYLGLEIDTYRSLLPNITLVRAGDFAVKPQYGWRAKVTSTERLDR